MKFEKYRRKAFSEATEWTPGMDMENINVGSEDAADGSPKEGDMICRNPKNHADMWLVAADYFEANFEPIDSE